MSKKELIITVVGSFLTGILLGMLIASKNGKVVVNGNHNVIRTGYKSYDGNHNGCKNGINRNKDENN